MITILHGGGSLRTPKSDYDKVSDLGYNRVAQGPDFESALIVFKVVVDPFLSISMVYYVISCKKFTINNHCVSNEEIY